ncbi:uncharacterized protein LOC117234931 isoform X2 [Bombus vosnesenskii]|uniref:Uncharacterized protein LOC117234931 isoform X2 n=1 Tax=Bombus vosnesenskii TaxID=207650 RepID=A0A6J3KHM1_9HYME|nr:uncharacterized protein LOC117234931 isoform X2 [Bombus vosnesenskii]
MWLMFAIVSLLIRAILASSEIDDIVLPDIMDLENESNDILTDNYTDRPGNDIWKVWKKTSFDPWSGKRAKEYSRSKVDSQGKRTKLTHDWYDRDTPTNEFSNVKRITESVEWTPFNSWGGKRAEKLNNRDSVLALTRDPHNLHLMAKDKLIAGRKLGDEKLSIETKNWLSSMCNTCAKKHCEIEKKTKQNEQYEKPRAWGPWHGKRSLKTYTFRFGNEYFTVPADSIKDERNFSPFRKHN